MGGVGGGMVMEVEEEKEGGGWNGMDPAFMVGLGEGRGYYDPEEVMEEESSCCCEEGATTLMSLCCDFTEGSLKYDHGLPSSLLLQHTGTLLFAEEFS